MDGVFNNNFPFKLQGSLRNLLYVVSGEFIGTFVFLWTAYAIASAANIAGVVNDSNAAKTIMIAFGFGFGVMIGIALTAKISGGNLNPAVTLTLILARAVDPIKVCGAAKGMFPGPVTFANAMGNGTNKGQGLMLEAFGTALLCITVLMAAVEKSALNDFAAVVIGISLFLGHLFTINFTGAGLNPARSLGAAIALRSFPVYFWIYWIGPIIGSIIAVSRLQRHVDRPREQQQGGSTVYRTSTTPPWFKLAKNRRFKEEYSSRIKEVTLLTLADLVILVDDDHWWGQYMFVVIDSMAELYSDALDNIKDLGNDVVTRYYKSTRLLFHKLQKIASNKFVFTIGGMKLFNQRVHVQSESVDSDNNDKETPTVKSAIQQILVPIISLKSDLNLYYTNRLIIYRDWVQDNEFGLQSKLTDFTESVVALNKGHMKCVPHYLYIDPAPITPSHSSKSGFFLVDGNGNLLDIDTDDAELQLGDDGMEVINSQEDDDSDVWD
ncbi:hypothetical protein CAS74_002027 [Pichia kudriavzevii]|uniref:Uncharacterized protein n=1 Tax=Pichia kudriavzevii TaxID=4909 RepID=A0A1Z8JP29_PICKU|nr:hypothetical protein CAS74_002027 [Pichia kudriavzevii]